MSLYGVAIENQQDLQTDMLYRIDDDKRTLIQRLDQLLNHRNILEELENLKNVKSNYIKNEKFADTQQKAQFEDFINKEYELINSNNKNLIKSKTAELEQLSQDVFKNNPKFYQEIFVSLVFNISENEIKDKKRWDEMSMKGRQALRDENHTELKYIISEMVSICDLPKRSVSGEISKKSLGIE